MLSLLLFFIIFCGSYRLSLSLMHIFAIFFVCSVGEPGEERAQGPGSAAGV